MLKDTLGGRVKLFGLTIKTAERTFTHRAAAVVNQGPDYAAFAVPILAVLQRVLGQIRSDDRQLQAVAKRRPSHPGHDLPRGWGG